MVKYEDRNFGGNNDKNDNNNNNNNNTNNIDNNNDNHNNNNNNNDKSQDLENAVLTVEVAYLFSITRHLVVAILDQWMSTE